jgi:hypothetical protein
MPQTKLLTSIRLWIIIFIICIILSGVTAFPIETELAWLQKHQHIFPTALQNWLTQTYLAIKDINTKYPSLSYGFDWLAFAHIVIGTAFIGPYLHPTKNIWVIQWAMIACGMVIPLAMIAGPIRQIPFWWQCIDCSFGVLGMVPLMIVYRKIKQLEVIESMKN